MLLSEIRKRREIAILSQLDKLGIARIDQLMKVTDLGNSSRRNALRVLREMERDGHVSSWRIGAKLFAVKGRGFGFWEHTLLRNDFLLSHGLFRLARMEVPIKKNGEVVVRADVGVFRNGDWKFFEVDRRQKKKDNLQKIQKYKEVGVKFEVVCYRDRAEMWEGAGIKCHIVEEWLV